MTTLSNPLIVNDEDLFYQQALISSIDDVIVSTDKNFIIKSWNAAAERIYEVNAAEATGRKIADVLFYQYLDSSSEDVIKKLVSENYWKGLVRVITSGGKEVILQSVITAVKDLEKRKLGYVGVSRDVTADLQVKQSLQNFSSVLALLEESFLIVDRDFKVVFVCPKGNVQQFFNSDYKVGDDAFKHITPVYYEEVKYYYTLAFKGEIIHYEAESKTQPKLYFDITYMPLKDDFGNTSNVCLIIKDITTQKEMELLQQKKADIEKSLYENRKLFEEFMENTPLLAWVVDENGIIHYMNPPYLKAFDFNNKIIGKNISELFAKELTDEYLANNNKVIDQNSVLVTTEKGRLPKENGTYEVVKFPIILKDKKMIAGWAVDISEQVAVHESLSVINRNKNKIMSVIAHDIRGPLAVNSGFINVIIEDFNRYNKEELYEHLQLLNKSLSKCFELTEELLLWARGQLETVSYNPVVFNANTEITKVIESVAYTAIDKKITIETDFCDSGDIYGDHEMFSIVLRNYISNAIKFSESESVILISTTLSQDKLLISVKDTGVGIKNELAEKLLHKLNYESSFGTKGEKGAGLGLIIAKDYIERNNGEMYIESEEGKGTVFSFTIGFANSNYSQ